MVIIRATCCHGYVFQFLTYQLRNTNTKNDSHTTALLNMRQRSLLTLEFTIILTLTVMITLRRYAVYRDTQMLQWYAIKEGPAKFRIQCVTIH